MGTVISDGDSRDGKPVTDRLCSCIDKESRLAYNKGVV
jgi:hypothetical protein